jgi:hypothetical protein
VGAFAVKLEAGFCHILLRISLQRAVRVKNMN